MCFHKIVFLINNESVIKKTMPVKNEIKPAAIGGKSGASYN